MASHEPEGRQPWADVLATAVAASERGHVLDEEEALRSAFEVALSLDETDGVSAERFLDDMNALVDAGELRRATLLGVVGESEVWSDRFIGPDTTRVIDDQVEVDIQQPEAGVSAISRSFIRTGASGSRFRRPHITRRGISRLSSKV